MRLSQKGCQPEFIEGYQFDCQYFDKLNMTIKLTFETASFFMLKDAGKGYGFCFITLF